MVPGMERFRIVQISDVHLGLIVRKERLAGIVEKIKAAGPDLLVSTGDLVDGSMDNPETLAAMLKELDVKHGKFAVIGNHEDYAGIRRSVDFIEKAGFTLVRGEAASFLPWLSIAGVDDPAGGSFGNPLQLSEKEILTQIPKDHFSLLLKHRPHVDESALGHFDLQLSGHTHKGQIFPFTLIIKSLFPIDAGRLDLQDGSTLYVSRGTGTWGPPIRFLSPPEVTVIDLVPDRTVHE
jgi:predicted MPP superfamily phosphohydrolase